MVSGCGISTWWPARSDKAQSFAISGSAPNTLISGLIDLAAMDEPASKPPPPAGVQIASKSGTSLSSSKTAVPCPVMVQGWSYGGKTTAPDSAAIR